MAKLFHRLRPILFAVTLAAIFANQAWQPKPRLSPTLAALFFR